MSSATNIIETEETLIIETPERVPLHFALASIGNRFLACALDHSLQLVAIAVLYLIGYMVAEIASLGNLTDAPKWFYALMIIFVFLIVFLYFAFFEWLWNGQTPGKRLLKLRVIREDGRPITFWEAFVRNLLRTFDMMPTPPLYSVGLIAVFISNRDQRVGDFMAGTVVVREREAEAPTFDQVFASPVSDAAYRRSYKPAQFAADLSSLTEAQMEVVEMYLRRRWDMPDTHRQWMAWRVAMPIMFKLRPAYDMASFTYEGFLEELLHRYREQHRFVN
jgi:uncharacterized RDD family membrane protein YckC